MSKRKKKKIYRDELWKHDMYPFRIKFIECNNVKQLHEHVPKLNEFLKTDDELHASTISGAIDVDGIEMGCIYMVVNPHGDIRVDVGAIAHECVHVKNFIFEKINHAQSVIEDEPEAYLVGQIMRRAMAFYKKLDGEQKIYI